MKSIRLNLVALVFCLFLFGCNDEPGETPSFSPPSTDGQPTDLLSPSPTPSPDPSPTPSPDPSPTPSPDPSPTPSPDPSPTPSPDPSPTPYSFTPTNSSIFAGIPLESGYEDGSSLSLVRFSAPASVAVAADGKLYITDKNLHTIRLYDHATLSVTTVYGKVGTLGTTDGVGTASRFKGPTGAVVLDGYLYVCDSDNNRVRKIDLSTGQVSTLVGSTAGYQDGAFATAKLNRPIGIASDGTDLYISDYNGHTIRKLVLSTTTVTTVAGLSGSAGNTDAIGTAAKFRNPIGIAASATELYISDYGNNRIRKIILSTGQVTTLSGSSNGYVNGTGIAARFRNPYGICLDGTTLYVSDYSNSLLRKVETATGVTSLAAGLALAKGAADGLLPSSRLGNPSAITCVTGAVIITDLYTKNIREFNTATGALTTRLGPSIAPIACSLVDGNLATNRLVTPSAGARLGDYYYFSDATNHVIRKLNVVTGQISLLAGKVATAGAIDGTLTTARFRTPLGVETDGIYLYVADSKNHSIRKIDLTTGTVTLFTGTSGTSGATDATALSASFKEPSNLLYFDNTLFIADTLNHAIRALNLVSAQVTTIAGIKGSAGNTNGALGIAKFNQPRGMALNENDLYIADSSNQTIRKVDTNTGITSLFAGKAGTAGATDGTTAARFNRPVSVALIESDLFVADLYNNSVRKISITSGSVSTINTATVGTTFGPSRESAGILPAVKYHLPQALSYDPTLGLILSNRCSFQLLTE